MPGISSLFRRLGFVKLDAYGLVLTSDGRILSIRPTVLDDGIGGRIVGWRESDPAEMALAPWQPKQVPRPVPAPVPASIVAAPSVEPVIDDLEDDEWEWEIAVARARAAAEWAEEAAISAITVVAAPPPPPPAAVDQWSDELLEEWITPPPARYAQMPAATMPAAQMIERPAKFPEGTVKTVIPIPSLPRVTDPKLLRPVITPRRYPRATGQLEDAVRTQPVPANDHRTSPGVAMPVGSSGAKRVAAKQP